MGSLKAMYTWQFTFPGRKLLFMDQEFAMDKAWNVKQSIDWHLADDFAPPGRDAVRAEPAERPQDPPLLYMDSKNPTTFEWVNRGDADRNIVAYYRPQPVELRRRGAGGVQLLAGGVSRLHAGLADGRFYKRVFSTYDSLPGQANPAEICGIPLLTAQWHDCDGAIC